MEAIQGKDTQANSPSTPKSALWPRLLCTLVILLVGGEIACRAFWAMHKNAPFFSSNLLWYSFYPTFQTSAVEDVPISNQDEGYDVLILGGSTVHHDFGNIGTLLREGLEQRLGRTVRVFNLSYPAHNTRDSLLKHKRLANQRFDLVVIYHGINDARMNCIPEGRFQDDYSHCLWYRSVNFLDRHPDLCRWALPFTLSYTAGNVLDKFGPTRYSYRLNPREEDLDLGGNIRTGRTFYQNLTEMVNRSHEKGERVVLMTYAYHVPEGFSLAGDNDYHGDYAGGRGAFRLWGRPIHVIRAIDEHNAAVHKVVEENPGVLLVDQRGRMTRAGTHFQDCCHLTGQGCAQFVEHVLEVVAPTNVAKEGER